MNISSLTEDKRSEIVNNITKIKVKIRVEVGRVNILL